MSEINFEQEVKQVYPDAEKQKAGIEFIILSPLLKKRISKFCSTPFSAWESAYNNLKTQGKL